jgi:hypothetical protein
VVDDPLGAPVAGAKSVGRAIGLVHGRPGEPGAGSDPVELGHCNRAGGACGQPCAKDEQAHKPGREYYVPHRGVIAARGRCQGLGCGIGPAGTARCGFFISRPPCRPGSSEGTPRTPTFTGEPPTTALLRLSHPESSCGRAASLSAAASDDNRRTLINFDGVSGLTDPSARTNVDGVGEEWPRIGPHP